MKLRALRLRRFGRFDAGVSLEGLSGGLDCLVAPNEAGKSTLLEALTTLLTEAHTAQKQALKSLASAPGASPAIEADLEIDGRVWRLRKQYLAGRAAELAALDGRATYHGPEAEAEAAKLVGARALRGLLWVAQKHSFTLPEGKDEELRGGLTAIIEREVAAATGRSSLRAVRQAVGQALGGLVTGARRQIKTGTPYAQAVAARDALADQHAKASRTLAAAAGRLEQLATLRARLAALDDPARLAALAEAESRAREALERSRDAAQRKRAVDAEVRTATFGLEAAARELTSLDDRRAAALAVAGETAAAEARAAAALQALRDAEQAAGDARQLVADVKRRQNALKAEIELIATQERAREWHAMRAAAATKVRVGYAPGVADAVRLDGRPLQPGEEIAIDQPLELEIAGIGKLTLTPGARAGVDGPKPPSRQERELLGQVLRVRGEVEAETAETVAALTMAEAALAERDGRLRASAKAHAEADADRRSLATQRDKLAGEALSGEAGETSRVRLLAALETAQAALNDAVRTQAAWSEIVPDETQMRALDAAAKETARARSDAERSLGEVRREIAGLEGAMRRDNEDGVGAEVERLGEAFQSARARAADFEIEVGALVLLDELLGAEEDAGRARYLGPITERLGVLGERVLPGAGLSLDGTLTVGPVLREGREEPHAQLSEGTKEQIAVLVRLAYARLISEQGLAAPLILDDPLVYSDDVRLAGMIDVLADASRHHQVLVLTCHEARWSRHVAARGGSLLRLQPWTG